MSDVSGVDNLTSSSSGSTSLTGIKSAVDNLNSGKAEISGQAFTGSVSTTGTLSATGTVTGSNLSGTNTGDQTLSDATITTTDITTNDVSSTKHGFVPKSPADATKFLNGATTPVFASPKDSDLSTTDITTNDVSTSKHGFAPKAPNDATKYLDGTGQYSVPVGTSKVRIYTDFETSGRFSGTVVGTGSNTFGSSSLAQATGATSGSSASILWQLNNQPGINIFAAGGVFTGMFNIGPLGTTASVFIGLGTVTVAGTGHTFTDAHIGFKVIISGSVATLSATCANGTETATSLGTIVQNDVVDLIAQIVSSNSVNFYWRKNGGALSAATNITTNIPTANAQNIQSSISNNSTASASTLDVSTLGFER